MVGHNAYLTHTVPDGRAYIFKIKIGNSIVNEHAVVANAFNEYFGQVASTIGNDKPIEEDECIESIIDSHNDHLSLHLIRDNVGRIENVLNFQEVN